MEKGIALPFPCTQCHERHFKRFLGLSWHMAMAKGSMVAKARLKRRIRTEPQRETKGPNSNPKLT